MVETCETCSGSKKVLVYPDGTIVSYMPARAQDSHHKGVTVQSCPDCSCRDK